MIPLTTLRAVALRHAYDFILIGLALVTLLIAQLGGAK